MAYDVRKMVDPKFSTSFNVELKLKFNDTNSNHYLQLWCDVFCCDVTKYLLFEGTGHII